MKFQVGDKVKCVNQGGWDFLEVGKIYTVNKVTAYVYVEGSGIGWLPSRFVLAEPKPFKAGDKVKFKAGDYVSENNNCTNKQVCAATNMDVNAVYKVEDITGYDSDVILIKARYFLADRFILAEEPAKEPTQQFTDHPLMPEIIAALEKVKASLPLLTSPVTRIMHNGITTVTFFSDGTKIVTRPSADDIEKYDPFVGWCVGVTERLYGGKKQAKEFYAEMAEVIKPVEQPIAPNETLAARQIYDKCVANRNCGMCTRANVPSFSEPCFSCWSSLKTGDIHHPHFSPKPFQE